MNEMTKTGIYIGIAVVLAALAFSTQPKKEEYRPVGAVNKALFDDFKDPGEAASLEIVRYLEADGKLDPFKVAKDSATGRWQIPSHSNYPADAENQMRDAATMFLDLKALGIASEVADDHRMFGVLEPDLEKVKAGDEGVGLKVLMQNGEGKDLVKLIIGKKVRGAEDQRFVRIPGQDIVYTVKINPDKLSTKFEDWIEKDLLKINAFDVERLVMKDYSVVRTNQGFVLDPKTDVTTTFDATGNAWKLGEFVTYKSGKPQPTELLPEEELNKTKLDDLKNSLDDIKIVDVARKPKGLGADLKAGRDFMEDEESVQSLFSRGFFPSQPSANAPSELRAANGELHVGMKDGVSYILRFGNVAGAESGDDGKLSRYLFVTAFLDESKHPEPKLDPLPDLPATVPAAAPASGDEKCGQDDEKDDKKDAPPAADAKDETKSEPAKPANSDEQTAKIKAERERIEKENQRKLDAYKENRKKAADKVTELNGRFSEWYYVISEDVYRKLRLGKADLFKEREGTKEEGVGVDAFRQLEKEGLKDAPPEETKK